MFDVRLGPSAERDMLDACTFYESQAAGLGLYFLDSLMADLRSLAIVGGVHAKPVAGFHRALAKRFPFAIYYDFDGEVVSVAAILDCRRDPRSIVRRLVPTAE